MSHGFARVYTVLHMLMTVLCWLDVFYRGLEGS